jgi:uncharacterized protein with PQ loop repeat
MQGHPHAHPATAYDKFLRVLGIATILLTIPQAVSVWTMGAAGLSLVTWAAYLAAAIAWLVYGIRKRDLTIWLECIGWIVLDVAIIAGIVAGR